MQPLPTKLVLRKKRAKDGRSNTEVEHYPVPASVTVRNRPEVSCKELKDSGVRFLATYSEFYFYIFGYEVSRKRSFDIYVFSLNVKCLTIFLIPTIRITQIQRGIFQVPNEGGLEMRITLDGIISPLESVRWITIVGVKMRCLIDCCIHRLR